MTDTFVFTRPAWADPRAEARMLRRDRVMGRLFLLFVLAIFAEGIIRKWLLPEGLQKPFYFLRDPILFAIYFHYLRHYRVNKRWVQPFLVYAFFIAILSLTQNIFWQRTLLPPLLGIRFYVFYLPLPFIMAEVMTKEQLRRVLLLLLWASIPVALLVMVQFSQPATAWINKGTADDGAASFTVALGIPRPYGPFTFASGQTLFTGLMAVVSLVSWERRCDLKLAGPLVIAAGFATMVMISLGGTRSGIITAGIITIFYMAAGLTSPRLAVGARRVVTIGIAVGLAITTFIVIFPRAYEAMTIRQENAVRTEGSTVDRALSPITSVTDAYDNAAFGGYGLGAGTNAARVTSGQTRYQLGEGEWQRMIGEGGPIFGTLLLFFRQCFAVVLFVQCLQRNRKTGDGSGMIMMGFVTVSLGIGQITSDNQALTFCWFATGLSLAFLNHPEPRRGRR